MRPQDAATTLVSVAINPRGRKLAWEFFVTNFDRIMAIFNTGGQAFLLSGLVDEIGSTGTSREDVRPPCAPTSQARNGRPRGD